MKRLLVLLFAVAAMFSLRAQTTDSLAQKFGDPPADARPWVYWFWNNGNVTSNGITADLEAMQRVGIGGVLIMDVARGRVYERANEHCTPPRGTASFMNDEWRNLFQFSVQEAARLGLEINMANGPGWCGSSGTWITPELSMQKLVWTNFNVSGPTNFSAVLPKPDTTPVKQLNPDVQIKDFYEDVALLAFPMATNGIVPRSAVIDLSAKLDADKKLNWEAPPGHWIIQRIGRTTTGSATLPGVVGGNGLECDKLSAEAMEVHFANMMRRLIAVAGKSLVATHIDSWEVGSQNWTPKLREEFLKRRGYDLLPWLPCITDSVFEKLNGRNTTRYLRHVDGFEMANRFRWDFAQTISELLAENYAGRFAKLAHEYGLRYTLEGYNLPFGDEFSYTARADEPMTEFWAPGPKMGNQEAPKIMGQNKASEMASVAHVYGHAIVGAEAFTSGDNEMWKLTPADIKSLGDYEFSQGVNRFVFHRYAHQPYLDRAPGVTMGPWGLHYERTQTWWEMSGAWHEYLSRCQFMLRQGKFVADLCYLRPEVPNQTFFTPNPLPPTGFRYDEISAEALIQRMSVKNGMLILPDGMTYRVLVLPPAKTMTPALLKKIRELMRAGAPIVATSPCPQNSPSLQDFPQCDDTVAKLGREIWGNCDGESMTAHSLGKGELIWGQPLEKVLAGLNAPVDFAANVGLNWIHRTLRGDEIYFVANPSNGPRTAVGSFRVSGKQPELWNPETGEQRNLPDFSTTNGITVVPLRFEPAESFFVVFRRPAGAATGNRNFPGRQTVADIAGPWQLSFPPNWGAPESATLTNLISWSDSAEDGVKYFSGTATYKTAFDFPNSTFNLQNSKFILFLGDVRVMARVKVNGQDCGVAWKPPFQVEITRAVRSGTNSLEIQVANLWPNRMIGDAALPEEKRLTWSSWEPFTNNTPLLKSGLLGPVRIESQP